MDLLHFLTETEAPLKVLVIESAEYLPRLRKLLPKAEICVVTGDDYESLREEYRGLNVKWLVMDYEAERLPYERYYFDYIIAERYLEMLTNPRDITAGLGDYLKSTGFLLTSFLNIRFWKIIEELKSGHFYNFMARPLAKPEVVRVLGVSLYKDIVFVADKTPAPKGVIEQLMAEGYDNFSDDLETELWLLKAGRSTAEVENLKTLFTSEVRKELSRLLRRIEFDIEREKSLENLRELCQRENIFPEYLDDFITSISTKPERLLHFIKGK